MAFRVVVDEYSVLSIGGAFSYVSDDSLNDQSFLFQFGKKITPYASVCLLYNPYLIFSCITIDKIVSLFLFLI